MKPRKDLECNGSECNWRDTKEEKCLLKEYDIAKKALFKEYDDKLRALRESFKEKYATILVRVADEMLNPGRRPKPITWDQVKSIRRCK